jgi:hypothetical protein
MYWKYSSCNRTSGTKKVMSCQLLRVPLRVRVLMETYCDIFVESEDTLLGNGAINKPHDSSDAM